MDPAGFGGCGDGVGGAAAGAGRCLTAFAPIAGRPRPVMGLRPGLLGELPFSADFSIFALGAGVASAGSLLQDGLPSEQIHPMCARRRFDNEDC